MAIPQAVIKHYRLAGRWGIKPGSAGSQQFRKGVCMLPINDLIGRPFEELKCWELVVEIYARLGIKLKHYTCYWPNATLPWVEVKEPVEKSVLVFCLNGRDCNHVGVYLGNGKFIHSTEYAGVCVEELYRYRKRLRSILVYKGGWLK